MLDIERGQFTDIRSPFWQTDTSVSRNSWGFVENHDYKTVADLVGDLVDIVSKNGALLLNVGPRADGSIPESEEALLLGIGRWLSINGEAIYGTRPWSVSGEGPTQVIGGSFSDSKRAPFTSKDVRFTSRGDTLYATVLARPTHGPVTISSLAANSGLYRCEIVQVDLLGSDEPVTWDRQADALIIDMPTQLPDQPGYVFRISPSE